MWFYQLKINFTHPNVTIGMVVYLKALSIEL